MEMRKFWLPAAMVAASLLGGVLANIGIAGREPDTPGVIQAKRFELRDDEGRVRAAFAVLPDGKLALRLHGSDGTIRGAFGLSPNGTVSLSLNDKDGQARSVSQVMPDGTPSITFFDKTHVRVWRATPQPPQGSDD